MLLITCQNLFELYTLCIISIQYMQEPICFCGGLVIWGQQNSKFVCCGNRIKVRLNEVWGEKTVCFACGRVKVKFKYLICGLSCVQSETWRVSDLIFQFWPRLDISFLHWQIIFYFLTGWQSCNGLCDLYCQPQIPHLSHSSEVKVWCQM